jgi:hypothetical protein
MPAYTPAGFSLNRDVQVSPGKITVGFRSNTDDKEFTITQQASNWSSQAMVNNHLIASNKTYQSYDNNGKIVYIYDNSNATWVNGGVWYQINGNATLTSDQLIRIASSL